MGCTASRVPADPAEVSRRQSTSMFADHARSKSRHGTLSGAVDGSVTIGGGADGVVRVEYAARTRPTKKDQDRFIVAPHGADGLVLAITDGHSVHDMTSGRVHAEVAARHLGGDLWKRVQPHLATAEAAEARERGLPSTALAAGATACFTDHQAVCERRYHRDVAARLLEEKRKLEEEIGEELPLELPQEGGTTATALALHSGGLLVAWVGDSRAVLALTPDAPAGPWFAEVAQRSAAGGGGGGDGGKSGSTSGDAAGGLRVLALTADHNTADAAELRRLEGAGGKVGKGAMNSHVSVPSAEGSLKVTRSLGDSPFHKDGAVSAEPGLVHVPLTLPDAAFAVVASDGVWDHLSNEAVVDIVAKAMRDGGRDPSRGVTGGAPAPPPVRKQRTNSVATTLAGAACDAVLDAIEAGQASGQLGDGQDDRAIAVLLLSPEAARI